jgi:hypothetical protein
VPLRLGRNASLHKNVVRRVQLAEFFNHEKLLPLLPSSFAAPANYQVPMYLNDKIGDCGPAACGHAVGQNSLMSTGTEIIFTDDQVRAFYFGITGGADSGVDMETMFSYWLRNPLGGESILAYAALRQGDTDQLEAAQFIFEGAVINGAALPGRVVPDDINIDWTTIPWTGTSGVPNPNNGHAFSQPGYVARGGPYFVTTWGDNRPRMDKSFYVKYVDAPFVVLTRSIINKATQRSGNNFDSAALLSYVTELTGVVPEPVPTPGPTPDNPPGSGCNPLGKFVSIFKRRKV